MPGKSFERLVDLMARLRSVDGCPWDREQTHESLKRYLIEEAYEVIDAIDRGDMSHLEEELGDLLLQVVFHAQLASESGSFDVDDVLRAIVGKLERRHPHVFGETKVTTPEEVVRRWERIKEEEPKSWSKLSGLPASLPALVYALKLQEKAARTGFDWDSMEGVLDKLSEEVEEIREAIEAGVAEGTAPAKGQVPANDMAPPTEQFPAKATASPTGHEVKSEVEAEIGDLLFSIVNVSRWLAIDPELALKRVCRKFEQRFGYMEAEAKRGGRDIEELSLKEKDRLWERAKKAEKSKVDKAKAKKAKE